MNYSAVNESDAADAGAAAGAAGSATALSQLTTKYAVVVLYLVTSVFGLSGNSLTILVLLRHRRVRTVATCFILNLAVADDLFIVSLPFMAYSTYAGRWAFGDVACRLMNTFWGVNLYASIFTMTLMSVDRYLAVVHPLSSISYRTCRNALVVCAVIWVFGFLFVLPLSLYSGIRRNQCQVPIGRSATFYTLAYSFITARSELLSGTHFLRQCLIVRR